jgi:thioredoxin reductase (NADPH)
VGDGVALIFWNKLITVVGGGDSAMKEANFLTKYGSRVYNIHRRDAFHASKIMQAHALSNPKILVLRGRRGLRRLERWPLGGRQGEEPG